MHLNSIAHLILKKHGPIFCFIKFRGISLGVSVVPNRANFKMKANVTHT